MLSISLLLIKTRRCLTLACAFGEQDRISGSLEREPADRHCVSNFQAADTRDAQETRLRIRAYLLFSTLRANCSYERQGSGGSIDAVHRHVVRAGIRHVGELA